MPFGDADSSKPRPTCSTAAADQLDEYFAGERTEFDLPLDPVGTPFQHAAWAVLRTIPFGETMTYGEQAARLGDPKAGARRRRSERAQPAERRSSRATG